MPVLMVAPRVVSGDGAMIPTGEAKLRGAATGWQNQIKGTLLSVPGTLTRQDVDGNSTGAQSAQQSLAGQSMGAGTFYFYIPTAGCANLDVTLRLGSGTAPTITLYPTLADGATIKGTATAVATVTGTQATTSLSTLRGEGGCILKIVSVAAFMLDQCEYCAL